MRALLSLLAGLLSTAALAQPLPPSIQAGAGLTKTGNVLAMSNFAVNQTVDVPLSPGALILLAQALTLGSSYNPPGNVYGLHLSVTSNTTSSVYPFGATLIAGTGLGSGSAAAQFDYVNAAAADHDGGALSLTVTNNRGTSGDTTRAAQIACLGPHACTNGLVFLNEVSPAPGGFFHQAIAFNTSFGAPVDTAYFTDNGNPTTPANVPYGTWYDGSTHFTTAEYDGPGFRIGPTAAGFNNKLAITNDAANGPTLSVVGAGATPATNMNLTMQALGTGTFDLAGNLSINQASNPVTLTWWDANGDPVTFDAANNKIDFNNIPIIMDQLFLGSVRPAGITGFPLLQITTSDDAINIVNTAGTTDWDVTLSGLNLIIQRNIGAGYLYLGLGAGVVLGGETVYTGVVRTTPTTGGTVTMTASQREAAIVPAGTLAALTIALPQCVDNGDEVLWFISQAVTALTVTAAGGSTVVGSATSAVAGSGHRYHCIGADNKWYQMN